MQDLTIATVGADARKGALFLLFSDLPPEQRAEQTAVAVASLSTGKLDPRGLLAAFRGARQTGVVLASAIPGRSAFVWPPALAADEIESTADRLLAAAHDLLATQGVHLAMAMLGDEAGRLADRLRRAGYVKGTELLYLVSDTADFPLRQPRSPLQFETFDPTEQAELVQLVDQTYIETQDCPMLGEMRQTEDVVEGYRQTGVFRPELWQVVRLAGTPIGCVLLADHPEHNNCELSYMGLVPAARGRGFGTHLVQQAQWLTSQAGRSQLVLGVDGANRPARAAYAAAGFRQWDRRIVFLHRLGLGPNVSAASVTD